MNIRLNGLSPHQRRNLKKDAGGILMLALFSPALIPLALILALAWGWMHVVAWVWVGGASQRVLFVYSDSPLWHQYCEEKVIPHLPQRSKLLNWSLRREWRWYDPSVALARFFGGRYSYNPIGLVAVRFGRVKVFRFWAGFRELKKGNANPLDAELLRFYSVLPANKTLQADGSRPAGSARA